MSMNDIMNDIVNEIMNEINGIFGWPIASRTKAVNSYKL